MAQFDGFRRLAFSNHDKSFNVFWRFSTAPSQNVVLLSGGGALAVPFSRLIQGIGPSVAVVGRVGIAATLAAGWILFGQRLNRKGWIGLVLLLAGSR